MKHWRETYGFSLVEVMVVVAIIGLMAGVVVLSLPGQDRDQRQIMERTERAFVAVSRSSIMTGRVLGLVLNRDGFKIVSLSDDGWVEDTSLLKAEVLGWAPLDLVSLKVDRAEQSPDAKGFEPQIWFLPTGEHPAFELLLDGAAGPAKISASATAVPKASYDE